MNPAFASPFAQAGLSYASNAVSSYIPGMKGLMESLRYYFDVNNSYVRNKLVLLAAPCRPHDGARLPAGGDGGGYGAPGGEKGHTQFCPPSQDINAPDLYIPAMAWFTFVLLSGLMKGTVGTFTPEVLSSIASSCLVMHALEVGLLKGGMYALNLQGPSVWDAVAYVGYKYVALVVNLTVGLLGGWVLYYPALLYTGAVTALFTISTLRSAVSSPHGGGAMKNYLVMGIAGLQFVLIWWLGGLQ
jgi:hypothetical protein